MHIVNRCFDRANSISAQRVMGVPSSTCCTRGVIVKTLSVYGNITVGYRWHYYDKSQDTRYFLKFLNRTKPTTWFKQHANQHNFQRSKQTPYRRRPSICPPIHPGYCKYPGRTPPSSEKLYVCMRSWGIPRRTNNQEQSRLPWKWPITAASFYHRHGLVLVHSNWYIHANAYSMQGGRPACLMACFFLVQRALLYFVPCTLYFLLYR